MLVNAENIRNLTSAVNKTFNDTFKTLSKDYETNATVVHTKAHTVNYAWLDDFPSMKEWVNDRDLKNLKAHTYTISKKDFEASVTVTRDDIFFDNLGLVTPRVKDLSHVVNRHYNAYIGNLIKTNGLCFDGKAFFAVDHSIGEAVSSNKTDKVLNQTNLLWMYSQIADRKDENNNTYGVEPTTLYVASDLRQTVMTILKSDTIEGSTNITKDLVKFVVLPQMESGSWCLVDNSRPLKPFIIQITKKAAIESDDTEMFKSKKIHYGIDSMDNGGYSFYQLAYFSDGSEAVE